ncbi:MAG: HlyD family type I secretion periplasmic adaptor subunit, partial [bacterium]|nr:HlyD family type I secretion periplasmic adaptor subunit [bacterium]
LLRINLEINSGKLREYAARQARLIAERDNQEVIIWNNKLLTMLDITKDYSVNFGQKKLFEAGKSARNGQISQLKEKIIQHESRIKGIIAQVKSIDAQIRFMEQELEGLRALKLKGLISNTKLLEYERDREELLRQNAAAQSELENSRNLINETDIQITQIGLEFRQSVLKELSVIDQEINDVVQQIHALLEKLKRVHIRAPVPGYVHELKFFTIGGVISPGDAIMQIIPHNDAYEVEIKVETQFIDELAMGQLSTLRFTSFNQKTTPELKGQIKTISANSIENLQSGIPYFKVNIKIPPNQLSRLNGKQLVPGMPVEAFIKTRERTALNYLMKPLLDQVKHAFREE